MNDDMASGVKHGPIKRQDDKHPRWAMTSAIVTLREPRWVITRKYINLQ